MTSLSPSSKARLVLTALASFHNNKEQPALSASPYPLYGRVVPRADRTDSAYTEELSVEDYREGYGDEQMVASKM